MGGLPLYVRCLWACSTAAQLTVLLLLLVKKNSRKLPLFTAYTVLNLCQAGFLLVLYSFSGLTPSTVQNLAWDSESITLLAQAFATTEVLGIVLKPYRGIWGLAWRALAATSAFVLTLVIIGSRSSWALAPWFELNRGYHLTFASAVIVCLLLVRYYSIPVSAAYKLILGGFCFYSCTEILINTFLHALLYRSFDVYEPIWQFSTMLSFVIVLVIWAVALRKPLPQEERNLLSPVGLGYQELSPEINEQLRLLNEKLIRLWKLEARPH
jgi:hypothetical protein